MFGDVMKLWDTAGYLASTLVVMAFCMKDIVPLRVVALTSNVAFLTYGIGLDLVPIWLLHAILLPINGWRLWQGISIGQLETSASSRRKGISGSIVGVLDISQIVWGTFRCACLGCYGMAPSSRRGIMKRHSTYS
jgi:hypothetical protein